MWVLSVMTTSGQSASNTKTNEVIEGGKLVVELIKVLGNKKEHETDTGCKNTFADLCIENQTKGSLSVTLLHRSTGETRDIVVQAAGKECFLQARIGVWTYDLKQTGSLISIRKGDLLIEGCNNLAMTIK